MYNRHIKKEYFHNNGIIEGEYKSYYPNGNIKEEAYYINGNLNGVPYLFKLKISLKFK